MAAEKLRIGYDNLYTLHPFVEADSENSEKPAENVTNWRARQAFEAAWTRNILDALGINWDLQTWSGGASAAPDDTTLSGAGATISRTASGARVEPYRATITRSGADTTLEIDLSAYVASYRWTQLTFGLGVESSTANTSIYITDDTGTSTQAHSGGGADEWLEVTRTIDGGATLKIGVQLATSNHSAIVDAFSLVEGASAPEEPAAPGDVVLDLFHNDGPVPNWTFSKWSAGPESAPDGWVVVGAGATVRRINVDPKVGRYCLGLVRSGTDCYARYRLTATQLAQARGGTIGFGGHSDTATASQATWALVFILRDGSTEVRTDAGTHTGGGSWEWDAAATIAVPHGTTAIELRAYVEGSDGLAKFDAPTIVFGAAAAETPHAKTVDFFAAHGHNWGSIGAEVLFEGSDDNFSSTTTLVAAFTPTDDRTLWKEVSSTSSKAHRLTLSSLAGRPYVGVLGAGEQLQMPEVLVDWTQHPRVISHDSPINAAGSPMESEVERAPVPRSIEMEWVEESWTSGELQAFLDHAGGDPLGSSRSAPFFVLPEGGDHPGDAYLMWCPNQTVNPAWSYGRRTERLTIQVLAVAE